MNRTATLCAFLAGAAFERIPRHITERAKDLVLDHLGVALHASALPWSAIVREQVLAAGDRPESTVYGFGGAARRNAALANATAAHGIELDDTHDESMSHPGAVVIPAALALAEARKSSGRDFLAAVVAGYEMQCRVGSAATESLIAQGFHPTASAGVYGAAAAAESQAAPDRGVDHCSVRAPERAADPVHECAHGLGTNRLRQMVPARALYEISKQMRDGSLSGAIHFLGGWMRRRFK